MKKQDIIILAALFALWLAWPVVDRKIIKPNFFKESAVPEAVEPDAEAPAGAVTDAALGEAPAPAAEPEAAGAEAGADAKS